MPSSGRWVFATSSLFLAAATGWFANAHGFPAARAAGAGAPADSVASAAHSTSTATEADDAASAANRALVQQLGEYKARALKAEEAEREAASALARMSSGPPSSLTNSKAEWSRMATESMIRLRTPCSSYNASVHFGHHSPRFGSGGSMNRSDLRVRLVGAGLRREEFDALGEVYERVHQKTWARIKDDCPVRERDVNSEDDSVRANDASIPDRIRQCQDDLLLTETTAFQSAVVHVDELRAAGASSKEARGAVERVMFALSESTEVLADETTKTLGREKASRVFEYGVLCVDEHVYQAVPKS